MADLTILLIPSDWDTERLARSIESAARLMAESGLVVQCQITELLPAGTDVKRLHSQSTPPLPSIVQRSLEREGFDYNLGYGATVKGLRRAVRCAKGRYVCLLREGDEIGFRVTADQKLTEGSDVLVAVPVASSGSLSAHQRVAKHPLDCRALPALVEVATAYDGALLLNREFLASLLSRVDYDAQPGYYGFLNEVLTLALVRDSGRVHFTEQVAVFPDPHHLDLHRKRISEYALPCVVARRRGVVAAHEAGTEAIIDAVLVRLAALLSGKAVTNAVSVSPLPEGVWTAGGLTAGLDTMLRWLVECVVWSWGWSPNAQPDPLPPVRVPTVGQVVPTPQVSLVSSAFRGQAVVHGFFTNLLRQTVIERCELIVVTPEANLVLDLVCEYFRLSVPQVRLIPLEQDPGIYGCWNIAIQASRGRYLSNANLDDRRDRTHVERLMGAIEQTGADVASAAVAITHDRDELIRFDGEMAMINRGGSHAVWFGGQESGPAEKGLQDFFLFDDEGAVTQCMNFPHCMPVWRRSLHDQYDFFDEQHNGTYADFAFWLRGVSRGSRFVHLPTPLGLYFVDPSSHSRRNASGVTWERIVRESLPANVNLRLPAHVEPSVVTLSDQAPIQRIAGSPHPRFNFGQQISQNYGRHRSGWAYAMQGLAKFHDATAPVYCDAFIEKHFVWGGDVGDGDVGSPEPHLEPWIGFIHVPPLVPTWFQFEQSNHQIFSTRAWQRSLPHCRGLFVLSEYHRRSLLDVLRPEFPISVLYHPTEFPEIAFDFDRYLANPKKRLVQIGWWLRKLNAIDRIPVGVHTPTMLGSSDWSKNLLTYAERRYHGITDSGGADVIDFLDNDAYDALLAENIAFVDFFDTSANNAVVECIARATPIAVCRHPAVDEYLGPDYPLVYRDHADAVKLIEDRGRVLAAHQYMKDDTLKRRFTLDEFSRSFANSEVAKNARR